MSFPPGFFHLNLYFARKAAVLAGLATDEALLRYTHLYLSFNLGRDFDSAHPVWQAYLAGLHRAQDPTDWTTRFYQNRLVDAPKTLPVPEFGCFSYTLWAGGRVRIHFRANDPGFSPLSAARQTVRRAELAAMFAHIRLHQETATRVVGGSWLYHLEAYRRLFPSGFLASAHTTGESEVQFIALWGQFLAHDGHVKADLADRFQGDVDRAGTLEALLACFPYPLLRLEGPIDEFYAFLGVQR